jgi:hypothetical protein
MKSTSYREAQRAFQYGRTVGALEAAKAMGSEALNPDTVRRLRLEVAAKIRQRASIVGKARRSRGRDGAQRYGLALKERLIEHRQRLRVRRVQPQQAVEKLRAILAARPREDKTRAALSRTVAELARFHLETADPMESAALREKLRQAFGFTSVEAMEDAGVKIETPLARGSSNRVFNVSFAVPRTELSLNASQITSILRSATGGARVFGVPGSPLTKFKRLLDAHAGRKGAPWVFPPRETDEAVCCCCCRCDCEHAARNDSASVGKEHESAHPTWSSIPDDTEWHVKQMRVKEAWGIKPPSGGKSRGEGILIAHPDTGWREHAEYDQSQLRFDLALNVLENGNGKNATRHGTLTIPPALFQTHGTGTGGVIISAEANGHTHVGDVPFDKMIATSSNVQLTGIAPKAELAPIRCADGVVLLMDTNIHKAVEHAIDINAHVISISLGGILDADFERIIDRAVFDHNIIVVAAAGQTVNAGTNSVIEPANFTNVIAVAGSTPAAAPWDGSCHGPKVAVSAPARGVWFPNFFLDGTVGIYWGEGTSFSAAQVAAVAALWLAHWGRKNLIDRYGNVPLAHVFRQLLRRTAWKPKNWNTLYGAGIVDAYALLNEPLPINSDVVAPSDTDEFNLFDAFSDFVDMGGAIAGQIWGAAVGAGGPIGDLFGELLNLNALNEGLAVVGAMAEGAAGDMKAWADEQAASLWAMVDNSLSAAGDAWDTVIEGGDEGVEDVGDAIEEGGDLMEDIGDVAAEGWDQTVDFVTSLF